MTQIIHKLDSTSLSSEESDKDKFALDILVGLSETRKSIPSIYHYDVAGSILFNQITEASEYYPTNCEKETLETNVQRIAGYADNAPFNLVEFGPGDGSKTKILLDYFLKHNFDFQYMPLDISESALEGILDNYKAAYPNLEINGLVADYFSGVNWLKNRYNRKNLILFLGSNIGNFNYGQTRLFLRNLWNCLNDGDIVIIGFDLKKDIELLLKAYNDSEGVTAEFNLNLLRRINRELGGEFDLTKFRHFGTYDVFSGAMESYLVSLLDQDVVIKEIGRSFHFDAWEPIHTEYSYKYHESDIYSLAKDTGFVVRENMYDSKKYFTDSVWEVHKPLSNNNSKR